MAMMGGGTSAAAKSLDPKLLAVVLEKPAEAKKFLEAYDEKISALKEENDKLFKGKTADELLKSAIREKKQAEKLVQDAQKEADDIKKQSAKTIADRRRALDEREATLEGRIASRAAELQELQKSLTAWRAELGSKQSETTVRLEEARQKEERASEKEAKLDAVIERLESVGITVSR